MLAQLLAPGLLDIRRNSWMDECSTRARLHIPLLEERFEEHGMGGRAWRKHFAQVFPMPGNLAEPRVPGAGKLIAREEPLQRATSRVRFSNKDPDESAQVSEKWRNKVADCGFRTKLLRCLRNGRSESDGFRTKLRIVAFAQVSEKWLEGPFRFTGKGELLINGKLTVVGPAFRLSVQLADELRAVDDLKRISANDAKAIRSPTSLPCVQLRRITLSSCAIFFVLGRKRAP